MELVSADECGSVQKRYLTRGAAQRNAEYGCIQRRAQRRGGGDSPMQFLHFWSSQLGAKSKIRRNMCLVWVL